jgi:hypothetical protein
VEDVARLDRLIREGDAYRVSVAERKHGISLYVLALRDEGEYLAESRADRFPAGRHPAPGHRPEGDALGGMSRGDIPPGAV